MKKSHYFKFVNNDSERKNYFEILREAFGCWVTEKEAPLYYFTNLLYKKDVKNYRDYIGYKKILKIKNDYFYSKGRNPNLENKLLFNNLMTKNNIKTPIILGYNKEYNIIHGDEDLKVYTIEELFKVIKNMLEKTSKKSIFIKPVNGQSGSKSFKIDNSLFSMNDYRLIELFSDMKDTEFIFQETIIQEGKINCIYPNSINSLRVHTFYDRRNGVVEFPSALMRFGYGKRVIDNKGLFVSLNIDKWSLEGKGKMFLKFGGQEFQNHPDTQHHFHDTSLPYKKEVKDILNKAANLFENDFIGWDIAFTEDGPLIIEGNDNPHMVMAQIACGGLKNHPQYKRIFKEYI